MGMPGGAGRRARKRSSSLMPVLNPKGGSVIIAAMPGTNRIDDVEEILAEEKVVEDRKKGVGNSLF